VYDEARGLTAGAWQGEAAVVPAAGVCAWRLVVSAR
jgi:hypothetical protein